VPALLTHHFFGLDILAKTKEYPEASEPAYEAFMLGCQGPDPLFYTALTFQAGACWRAGSFLHQQRVAQAIDAFILAAHAQPDNHLKVLDAYLRGWIAHFSLDSLAHPLIISQEQAITSAGILGLGQEGRSEVHSQIEADLDSMMLMRRYGLTIRDYKPTDSVLVISSEPLDWISTMYRQVVEAVLDIRLTDQSFRTCVQGMRLCYRALYSPSGIKRSIFGHIERIFRAHSMAQAASHCAGIGLECDFDNHEHALWINPFTGEESHSSFLDIYGQAVTACVERLGGLSLGASGFDITNGLNFNGKICD